MGTYQRDKAGELRLGSSAPIRQGGEPGQKAVQDLTTTAKKPILSTSYVLKFPSPELIYLRYAQSHDTGCFIILNKLKYIQIYNSQQDRKL